MSPEEILSKIEEYISSGRISEEDFSRLFSSADPAELNNIRKFLELNDVRIVTGNSDDISIFDLDDDSILTDEVLFKYDEDIESTIVDTLDDEYDSNNEQYISKESYTYNQEKRDKTFYQRLKELSSDKYQIENPKLLSQYKHGDMAAFEQLIINNNRLVWKQAYAFAKMVPQMDVDDLFQAGVLGMMRALEKFDPSLGAQFSTYAVFWIRQSIMREIDDNSNTVRIPVHMMEQIRKVSKLDKKYDMEGLNYDERVTHISEALGISKESIEYTLFLKNVYVKITSLDVPVGEDNESLLGDFIADPRSINSEDIEAKLTYEQYIKNVLSLLDERERNVIIMRFGLNGFDPMTLEEIGAKYNVTRERIRQIESKALGKIKKSSLTRRLVKELELKPIVVEKKKKKKLNLLSEMRGK